MRMLMVDVRIMWLTVRDRFVGVRVRMRLVAIPFEIVRMLVMRIVHMAMRVGYRVMGVQVLVVLGQVEPYARAHQHRRHPERRRGMVAEGQYRDRCSHERCRRKIRAGAR